MPGKDGRSVDVYVNVDFHSPKSLQKYVEALKKQLSDLATFSKKDIPVMIAFSHPMSVKDARALTRACNVDVSEFLYQNQPISTGMIFILFSGLLTLLFYRYYYNRNVCNSILCKMIVAGCFVFSWSFIVIWFMVMIESWQISYGIPVVNASNLSAPMHQVLQHVFLLFPMRRIYVAIIYALPALIIPLASASRSSTPFSILLRAACLNTIYFWVHVALDRWTSGDTQALILLITYFILLYLLLMSNKRQGYSDSHDLI